MKLLEIIQEFCVLRGLPRPTVVMQSQDDQLLQIVGMANWVCRDLTRRHDWQVLTFEAVWPSVAGEDQGDIETLFPYQFKAILGETLFDRTRRLPLLGPKSAKKWQGLKALPFASPLYQYRITGNRLRVIPAMPAGHTLACEYSSKGCVKDVVELTAPYKSGFTKDDDTFLLDEQLLFLGLNYRWRAEKGFAYSTEFQDYEVGISNIFSRDGTKPTLSMDGGDLSARPGIMIPIGNWNQP